MEITWKFSACEARACDLHVTKSALFLPVGVSVSVVWLLKIQSYSASPIRLSRLYFVGVTRRVLALSSHGDHLPNFSLIISWQ